MSRRKPRRKSPKKGYKLQRKPLYLTPPDWVVLLYSAMPRGIAEALARQYEDGWRYGLVDPRTGDVFAVGETRLSLPCRLDKYLRDSASQGSRIHTRVAEILEAGFEPTIVHIEAPSEAAAMAMFPASQLFNERAAGGGPTSGLPWPPEWIALLGHVPDRVLAELRGVSKSTIGRVRAALGVRCYRDSQRRS